MQYFVNPRIDAALVFTSPSSNITMAETHDYISEGMEEVNLRSYFPHMIRGDTSLVTSEFFRKEVPHTWYVTPDFPECGFLSIDEVRILIKYSTI